MDVLQEKRSSPELRGYVKERVRRMRERMEAKGVDVSILLRPENVFYFSNFNPIIISHVPYFIITKDDAFLLVHSIRHDHAVNEGAADRVLCYGKWGATQAIAMDAMDAMRELLGGEPLTVGVEGDYASMNFLSRLKTKLQVKEYVDVSQDAVDLRLIKDPHEIKMCRISGELVDLGVTRAIQALGTVNLGALEGFTPEEAAHLAGVAQRQSGPVSEAALADYTAIIRGEHQAAEVQRPEDLLALRDAMRKRKGYH